MSHSVKREVLQNQWKQYTDEYRVEIRDGHIRNDIPSNVAWPYNCCASTYLIAKVVVNQCMLMFEHLASVHQVVCSSADDRGLV